MVLAKSLHDVAGHLLRCMVQDTGIVVRCKAVADTVISGISPAIAQTIAELGIDLGAIQTTSTIESALRESISGSGA